MKKTAITTKSLKVGYDKTIIVPDFDLSIPKGKIASIIGPNGCGKSTVLKAIGRILKKAGGKVFLSDIDIDALKTKDIARILSILPQSPTAPGTITCFDLVSYGRFPYQKGFGKLSQEDKEIIQWALKVTNMEDFARRPIASLSGGQRQRVWIAMALAQKTDIILLDEPTTYLDLNHQLEVLELLKSLNEKQGVSIVMVLHDLNLASKYSDYLIAMKDGRIVVKGTCEEVLTKETLQTCFLLDGDITTDPRTGKPICVSYDRLRKGENTDEKN